MQDFLEKNRKTLLIGGIATGAASALIYLLCKGGKEEVQLNSVTQQQQQVPQNYTEQQEKPKRGGHHQSSHQHQDGVNQMTQQAGKKSREQLLKDIVSKIEVRFIGKTSTIELSTISSILEHSIELAEEKYIQLTVDNRRKRRAVMRSDHTAYEQFIMEYNEQVEQVLVSAQEEMLEALKVEKEQFEESVLVLMERGLYQQMYMLQAAIRQKIKEKIPANKEVSMEKTKEVIQYQVKVLKEKPDFFKNIISKLQSNMETANMIPMVLNTMLQDLIFEEFKIEEEDQMKNMMGHQILNDPDVHELLMEIEEAMYNLMGSIGMGGQGDMM